MTTSLIQAAILMVVGLLIGIQFTPLSIVLHNFASFLCTYITRTYYWKSYGKLGRFSINC
jgi:hypothetical protein